MNLLVLVQVQLPIKKNIKRPRAEQRRRCCRLVGEAWRRCSGATQCASSAGTFAPPRKKSSGPHSRCRLDELQILITHPQGHLHGHPSNFFYFCEHPSNFFYWERSTKDELPVGRISYIIFHAVDNIISR